MQQTDVLIIGGGISGVAAARELSRYEAQVTLVEKEADVGWGQTKAGYAIRHPGVRWPPRSLARSMIEQGNRMMDRLIHELDIEFKPVGELVLAFDDAEIEAIEAMKAQGMQSGIQGMEIIGREEVLRLEPHVSDKVSAALFMPTAGVFNPFDLLFAFYENAVENGVRVMLETEVLAILPDRDRFVVTTSGGEIRTAFVVNAAGLLAGDIGRMAGSGDFEISAATKGSCLVVDRRLGGAVRHIVTGFQDPRQWTRYKLVTPTFHDKILLYTSFSEPAAGVEDRAVAARVFDVILRHASDLVPDADFRENIIAAFSSIAARNDRGDFIVERSSKRSGIIHVAPTPPGLTASPAIGRRVAELLRQSGLELRERSDFNPFRKAPVSLRRMSRDQIAGMVREDPRFGRVICRCETVTEGEVAAAIRRGAATMDGIKFRTQACMGRCQGNYCGPDLARILARETGQALEKVTKKGRGSAFAASAEK